MSEQPEKPDLNTRRTRSVRTINPAPDEGHHPIEPAAPQRAAQPEAQAADRKLPRVNVEVTEEVSETLELARYKTKKTKRALIEEAVLHYWSQYTPGKN